MKKVKLTKPLSLDLGQVVELDKDMAKDRGYCLRKIGGNLYTVTGKATFKAGQVIGMKDIPKWMRAHVVDPETEMEIEPEIPELETMERALDLERSANTELGEENGRLCAEVLSLKEKIATLQSNIDELSGQLKSQDSRTGGKKGK